MALKDLRERLADRLFGDVISERVCSAVQVVDDEYWSQIRGGAATLDEDWNARKENLDDALEAWRSNPLARRIVSLCTDYVVGSGIVLQSEVEWVQKFVAGAAHPLENTRVSLWMPGPAAVAGCSAQAVGGMLVGRAVQKRAGLGLQRGGVGCGQSWGAWG